MVISAFPILSTSDLAVALGFYRDLLGGQVRYQFPPGDDAPVYVAMDLGSSALGIAADPATAAGEGQRWALWVYVADCDAAVRRLRSAGTTVLEEPAAQPWGERVAKVADPDGNVVHIGQQ